MGIIRGTGRLLKPLVNVSKWMNTERLSHDAGYIGAMFKGLFKVREADVTETFEEALERLSLTEDDIKKRYKEFQRLFWFFLVASMIVFFYAIYIFIHARPEAGVLSLCVTGLALAQTFRFHFWLYQIKTRKLGARVGEWFKKGLLGLKNEKSK